MGRDRERKRSRSRDREKHRDRDGARTKKSGRRDRSQDRSSKRSRSRDRKREKQSRRSRSRSREKDKSALKTSESALKLDELVNPDETIKTQAEQRLEAEMQKRRERIERWRAERKAKLDGTDDAVIGETSTQDGEPPTKKTWTLEDDDEADDEGEIEPVGEQSVETAEPVIIESTADPDTITDDNVANDESTESVEIVMAEDEEKVVGDIPVKEEPDDCSSEPMVDSLEKPVVTTATDPEPESSGQEVADVKSEPVPMDTTPAVTDTTPEQQESKIEVEPMVPKVEPDPEPAVPEEIDPLDAFMMDINSEVRKLRNQNKPQQQQANGTGPDTKEGVKTSRIAVVIQQTSESNDDIKLRKGDVMEQNADTLQYADKQRMMDEIEGASGQVSLATKAKQLKAVDHERIWYRPFRRDFYIEVPELAKLTDIEVDDMREELEDIQVNPSKRCPKPVRTWGQTGCSKVVLDVLKKSGYDKPTPIQAQAIPVILRGRDLIGVAKTGSGKTLAFLIPMFRHILDQDPLEDLDGPIAIILSPTRELAIQTFRECKKFCKYLNISACCVYGGTSISEQIAELRRGCEIVVCTPGRMIDMLAANNGRVTNLRRVTYLVLDEADRMFDMGFEPQVMRIINDIRPDRQTVMFSATFPRMMESLAKKTLIKPIEVQVGGRSVVCNDVEQHVCVIEDDQKFFKLLELFGQYSEQGSMIVFVDKQEHADELLKDLIKQGYSSSASLHGGIDQHDRDSIITDFKNGIIKILVATSVAARGLDVKNLILVVNYDCPNHYEDYVHRVGRTGRAGNKGYAYTFVLPLGQEMSAGHVVKALEQSSVEVPPDLQKVWNDYVAKMKEEGKTVRLRSGFRGTGFKFDEEEAEAAESKRKMEKLVHGLQDSDDDDEFDIEEQIQRMLKSTRKVKEGGTGDFMASQLLQQQQEKQKTGEAPKANVSALEKASIIARKINQEKNIGVGAKNETQQTAEAILKGQGGGAGPTMSSKTIAAQLAAKINEKLNYIPEASSKSESEEFDASFRFEEEVEINDFPQQVRWRITSRETCNSIMEYCDVGITVRGVHVPTGKKAPDGDRPLFLSIESRHERTIVLAKQEIVRLIREEMKKMASSAAIQNFNRGRYKVL